MQCRWKDLGEVDGPGDYQVDGIGIVSVVQRDIDEVNNLGGNPRLELLDVTGNRSVPEYRINRKIPMKD